MPHRRRTGTKPRIMMGAATTCVSCGAPAGAVVCEKRVATGPSVILQRCTSCGLVFRRGWDTDFESEYYDYYSVRTQWPRDRVYKPVNERRLRELLRHFGELVVGRRLLDVGCGAGQLVSVANAMGWEARGIDLSRSAVTLAARLGANCKVLDFFSSDIDRDRFDVIVMSEFIEHVPQPGRFLRRAHDLLADGGLVYLTTPNFRSLSRYLVGTDWSVIHHQHLSYFTPSTFRQMVADQTDLAIESLDTRNVSPEVISRLRSFFRGSSSKAASPPSTGSPNAPPPDAPSELRTRIERSPFLRGGKHAANVLLNAVGIGEGLVATLRKPGGRRVKTSDSAV